MRTAGQQAPRHILRNSRGVDQQAHCCTQPIDLQVACEPSVDLYNTAQSTGTALDSPRSGKLAGLLACVALRQHSAQRAVTMSRHACQQHRSEIGQAYRHTVTASLSDHGTIYTVLRSAHGLFIPLKMLWNPTIGSCRQLLPRASCICM